LHTNSSLTILQFHNSPPTSLETQDTKNSKFFKKIVTGTQKEKKQNENGKGRERERKRESEGEEEGE
jgi:hypothetical protein